MKFFIGVILLAIVGLCSCQTNTPGFSFTVASSGGLVMSSVRLDGLKPSSKYGVIHTDAGNVNLFVPYSAVVADSITLGLLFEITGFCELSYNTTTNIFYNRTCWLLSGNPVSTQQGFNPSLDWAFASYATGASSYNVTFSASKQGSSCAGWYYAHTLTSIGTTTASLRYVAGDLNGQGNLAPSATFGAYRKSTGQAVIDIPSSVTGSSVTVVLPVTGNKFAFCGFSTKPLYENINGALPCAETSTPDTTLKDATCTFSTDSYTAKCFSTNGQFGDYTITSAINSVACGAT